MATGGLARGFLLKGGRQGLFTAGSSKLSASATRTNEVTEENEKQSELESIPTTGKQASRPSVNGVREGPSASQVREGAISSPVVQPIVSGVNGLKQGSDVNGSGSGGLNESARGGVNEPKCGTFDKPTAEDATLLRGTRQGSEAGVNALKEGSKSERRSLPVSGVKNSEASSEGKADAVVDTAGSSHLQELQKTEKGVLGQSQTPKSNPATGTSLRNKIGEEGTTLRGVAVVNDNPVGLNHAVQNGAVRDEGRTNQGGSAAQKSTDAGSKSAPTSSQDGVSQTRVVKDFVSNVRSEPPTEAHGAVSGFRKSTVCEIEEVFEDGPSQAEGFFWAGQHNPPLQDFLKDTLPSHVSVTAALFRGGGVPGLVTNNSAGGCESLPFVPPFRPKFAKPESNPGPPSKPQPNLPPEMVSFLFGPSQANSTGLRKAKHLQPNPFDQTPPGWSAELSLASAVAHDDVATRFANLPTAALQSVFSKLPASAVVQCQAVSKAWCARFSDDPKLWASVDLGSDARLREAATDDLLLELLARSKDRWGTSSLTSLDVTGCKNISSLGLMNVMKHRGSLKRLRTHGSGAQLPVYFARWLAGAGVDAHVDVHTAQSRERLGLCNVALGRATWQDLIHMLAGSTCVQIRGLDLRPTPVPLPPDLAIPFLTALHSAPNLQTLHVGSAFGDRALLRDCAAVLAVRSQGLEVLEVEGNRGNLVEGTWEAVSALLGGDRCRLKKLSIKDCNLGPEGAAALSGALSENSSVTELELSDCGLDANAWQGFAEALLKNTVVRKLAVGGWGWKAAKAETGPLAGPPQLIPDDDGVGYLGAAISRNTTLEHIRFAAWCGPAIKDSTGRVVDFSPGFATFLVELGRLDPRTSRLKSFTVEYGETFLEDRGQAGADRVAAIIGLMVQGKGVRVTVESSAKKEVLGSSTSLEKALKTLVMKSAARGSPSMVQN